MTCKTLRIGNKEAGAGALFFSIEEGMANLGNLDKAFAMVDAAVGTGADAIEFQLVLANDLYIAGHPGYSFCLGCEFSDAQVRELVGYVRGSGLECIVAPLSHRLVENLVISGCSGFNINASDINNPQIIDTVAQSGLPFFLSTLLASDEEIDWAIMRILKVGSSNFGILHGQHTMFSRNGGVDPAQTALGYIPTLKRRYGVPVGFIDHTPFPWMPAAAASAGADMVTKHMTISRADKGPDWQICLEPEEMKNAVTWARSMRESVSAGEKQLADGEELDLEKMRRSVVSSQPLSAGTILSSEHLKFKRPGTGLGPPLAVSMLGMELLRDMESDEQIFFSDLRKGEDFGTGT